MDNVHIYETWYVYKIIHVFVTCNMFRLNVNNTYMYE